MDNFDKSKDPFGLADRPVDGEQLDVRIASTQNYIIRHARSPWAQKFLQASAESPLFDELLRLSFSGNFDRLDTEAIRHHFVPEFSLKEFAIADSKSIAQISTRTADVSTTSISGAASRRRLYQSTQEDGSKDNRLEGYLALIDDHGSTALRRLMETPNELSDADRATLSVYFSIQMMRTPSAATNVNAISNATFRSSASTLFSDLNMLAANWERETGEKLSGAALEAKRDEIVESIQAGEMTLSGANGATFSTLINLAMEQSGLAFMCGWHILESDNQFVTSDRAYSCRDTAPPSPWATQTLLSSMESQTVIPLSPKFVVMLRPGRPKLTLQKVSDADAMTLNLRTWGWAADYVFGHEERHLQTLAQRAAELGESIEGPRAHFHSWLIDVDPDDDSIAKENEQKGWPKYVEHEGELHDYLVISVEEPDPDVIKRINEIGEARARKRLNLSPDDPPPTPSIATPDPTRLKFHP